MTITRSLDYSSYATGVLWATDIDATVNWLSGLQLGRLTSVSGTNAITATMDVTTGFTALSNSSRAVLIPANANTGSVTLNIESTGAVAIKNSDGDDLVSGDLAAGRAYDLQYDDNESAWRVLNELPSQAGLIVNANAIPPFLYVEDVVANATWTAPHDCYVRMFVRGAGGAGGFSSSGTGRRSGGGAGGAAIATRFLESGEQLTIVVGAGGAGGATAPGGTGGNTTVTGPDSLSITCNGGVGGSSSGGGTVQGGAGGTASGGDINVTGQNGADASGNATQGAGGTCGFMATIAEQSANTATASDPFTAAGLVASRVFGPYTSDSPINGGDGNGAGASANGGYGGGSGGSNTSCGDGGDGLVTLQYTGPIT